MKKTTLSFTIAGIILLLIISIGFAIWVGGKKRCFYVASYHKGYPWQDGLAAAVEEGLSGYCRLKSFYLDTIRQSSELNKQTMAKQAWAIIQDWQPNIVIASDDNASQYLVEPYLKGSKIPVVFCGVNFSAEKYGYPYPNVTGMVEFEPIRPMMVQLKKVRPSIKTGVMIAAHRITNSKLHANLAALADEFDVTLDIRWVNSFDQLKTVFLDSQQYDFIYIPNNHDLKDWDEGTARKFFHTTTTTTITVSTARWMQPFVMLSFFHLPEEQGYYAANTALKIMAGTSPADIPITTNKDWRVKVNQVLLDKIQLQLPSNFKHFIETE
ncbi:ABC transporter substrate-binding protein [Spartinivicinus ruber]|uniref:ABC transporter substrate-binding protein n=1 Tax=Spartinivicinus ruber TaxID=2683272 RepID=UPI0013D1901F|nr:ABC transporter substrate binding protein [Spartinivicinus ruber]